MSDAVAEEPSGTPVPDGRFHVTARVQDACAVLEVSGDVDATTCGRLEHLVTVMLDDAPQRLTVDLSRVTFMDSSGIRALLHAHELGRARRAEVVVADPSTPVRRVLAWTGLDTVLTIVEQPRPTSG